MTLLLADPLSLLNNNGYKMNVIKYTAWKPGFLKISLQIILQEYASLSLGESKIMVDKILRNQVQEVYLEEVGAVCELRQLENI